MGSSAVASSLGNSQNGWSIWPWEPFEVLTCIASLRLYYCVTLLVVLGTECRMSSSLRQFWMRKPSFPKPFPREILANSKFCYFLMFSSIMLLISSSAKTYSHCSQWIGNEFLGKISKKSQWNKIFDFKILKTWKLNWQFGWLMADGSSEYNPAPSILRCSIGHESDFEQWNAVNR